MADAGSKMERSEDGIHVSLTHSHLDPLAIMNLVRSPKAGAIVPEKIHGEYHMYWGEGVMYHATSADLISWTTRPQVFAYPVHDWEGKLIEPGPTPIKTRDGRWILVYNGMTTGRIGYPKDQYSTGQMLIDPSGAFRPDIDVPEGEYQPALMGGPIARIEKPMLVPTGANEEQGLVDQVVFSEGLVQYRGTWFLYFGQADSTLGVATAEVQPWGAGD